MRRRRAYLWWSSALGALALVGVLLASPRFLLAWNGSTPGWLHLARDGSIQVGGSIVGGVVVATAVLFFDQSLAERRNRRDFHLSLSIAPTLQGANLEDAYLRDAYLRDKCLAYARLDGADLAHANLFGADLSDARLFGANLDGAYLGDSNLTRVMWNARTLWPTPELQAWVLARSRWYEPMRRYHVHGEAIVPIGLGVPASDPRFDPAAGSEPAAS